ncbi:hypothetical protein NLU13_3476 [Sarocladium strictum]|uniref:Uncharacterized protein n=1 Tax=Sarocladium strictum TaxID=5046 RepID=A0AA39GM28_SARSR|nr:hypothetical protein NLU13_3476 [Sarocladium strictum]
MASHIYSAEELLCIRSKLVTEDVYRKLFERLRKDADLGGMILLHAPQQKKDQLRYVRTVTHDEGDLHSVLPRQLDGTDGEWRYRGRTDSEQAKGQPISAPSGIVAQKDEGFQKFYKAVVSPTHVRVTAGGRIVPNTRGSVSPVAKLSADRPSLGDTLAHAPTSNLEPSQTYGFPVPPSSFPPIAPVFSSYGPAIVPGMPPPAFPLISWHPSMAFGPSFPLTPGAASSVSQPQASSTDPTGAGRAEDQSESGSVKASSSQGHVAHNDYYRGGVPWMMPPNHPFYHIPYRAPQGYPLPPQTQMMAPMPADSSSQSHSVTSKGPHSSTKSAPMSYGPLGVAIAQSPMSSIRPSEITKNQIGVLRNSLKYLEDQLMYNRHQVDEQALEHQVDVVKQQIRHFEKNLHNQLTFESNHYPKSADPRIQPTSASSSRERFGSKVSIASEERVERKAYKLSNASNTSLAHSIGSKRGDEKKTSFSTGINSTKSVSAFAPIKASARAFGTKVVNAEQRRASASLPSNAALAPPFEPQQRENFDPLPASKRSNSRPWAEADQAASSIRHDRRAGTGSRSMHSEALDSSATRLPYLIGFLPAHANPKTATDADYAYTRTLTEDELRARHMYWGNTPRELQKGLPKFDGKDFYPPSPTKGRSTDRDTSSTGSSRVIPVGNPALDYGLPKLSAEADLFRSVEYTAPKVTRGPLGIPTQSEAIARSSRGTDGTTESVAAYGRRSGSCAVDAEMRGPLVDDVKIRARASSPSLPDKSSSDEAEDDKALLFKGRRGGRQASGKSHSNEIWRSMLKKGKTSGNVVPGAVSSTTVQGVLPQYSGYASASLAPAIANSTTPPPRLALGKAIDVVDGTASAAIADRKRENRPPQSTMSPME